MRSIRSSGAAGVAIIALALASFSFAGQRAIGPQIPSLSQLELSTPDNAVESELVVPAAERWAQIQALEIRAAQIRAEIADLEELLKTEPVDNGAIWCDANGSRPWGHGEADSQLRAYLYRESKICIANWNAAPARGEMRPASPLQI